MRSQGGQGPAVAVAQEQGRQEFVADFLRLADLDAVGLGGVVAEVQLGPVQGDEGEVLAVLRGGVEGGLEQGLGQAGEGGAGVEVEAPGGHGGGLGGLLVGQDAWAGGTGVGMPGVLLDELPVAVLEPFLDIG